MPRKEREIEQTEQSLVGNDEKETQPLNDKLLDEMKVVEQHTEEGAITLTHLLDGDCRQAMGGVKDVGQDHSEENLDLADVSPVVDSKGAKNSTVQVKPRVIMSVKDSREYLSRKCDKNEELRNEPVQGSDALPRLHRDKNENQVEDMANNAFTYKPEESDEEVEGDEGDIIDGVQRPRSSLDDEGNSKISMMEPSKEQENGFEENFGEFEPIVKKIGVGFRDNYMVSRKEEDQESSTNIAELGSNKDDDSELACMKDDSLREIVLQVQENELKIRLRSSRVLRRKLKKRIKSRRNYMGGSTEKLKISTMGQMVSEYMTH
ncbi:hypothetical protein ACLB2K_071919 [Fragaria x ananassa]